MDKNGDEIYGLNEIEVRERLVKGLQNTYEQRPTRSYLRIIFENIFTFYNALLFLSITFLIVLRGSKEVFFSTILLVFNISFSLSQELRAKRMLDALSRLSHPNVTVRRNRKEQTIPANQIVRDDIIILKPGDPVVVDGKLLFSENLEIDASSLTGESVSVQKDKGDMLISGSYCVAGYGIMQAEKVGSESHKSRLQQVTTQYTSHKTPLEKRIATLLRGMIIIIAIFGPLTVIAGINVQLTFSKSIENLVNLLLSLVPQGLLASITILFAYGALRISNSRTIVQRMNAIESMGHITVLCADKTGTLTKNLLIVREIIPLSSETKEDVQKELTKFTSHISAPNQTISALLMYLKGSEKVRVKKIHEVSFNSRRKWSGIVFASETLILGAPEIICNDPQVNKKSRELSTQGLRVLLFSRSTEKVYADAVVLPKHLKPLALITFADAIRTDVPATLQNFKNLGIEIKILSGDSVETVRAIARQAGIKSLITITQKELLAMEKNTFDKAVRNATLFARIEPEMKRTIITSLLGQGMYVGMVGDGINDVFALKKAKVAIAMNDGAQITKDVSDIILLDNALSTLPIAIEEGRDIIQRIYAVAKIFFVKVIYLTMLFFLVGFANLPFPVNLRQTTLLGLMITGIPILLITFRILTPEKQDNPAKDFIEYTLLAGCIGGLALAYLFIISVSLLKQDVDLSTTLVTVFATLYSTIVLWNVIGISPFDVQSVMRYKKETILIGMLGLGSMALPLLFFPNIFNLVRLGLLQWFILCLLTSACAYCLWFFDGKLHLQSIWQNLYK